MSRIAHMLHVYEKPAQGEEYVSRFLALNYRHKISAMGGFDTASCDVGVDRSEAEFVFGNLVGNRVAVYADNPVVPIWEGLISRVTIVASGAERTRSLEDMANRVVVQFTGGALNMTQTGEVTNTASIDIYGSKMKHFDAGEMYSNATSFAEALRDARLTQLAYPPVSTVSGGGGDFRVSIEMIGFYQTLAWDTFEVIDTGTVSNAPAEILLDGTGDDYSYNYGIFYSDSDSSRIASTAWSINNSRQLGESSWDLLLRIAEAGDNGDRRIVGISETNPNTSSRIAYYEDANETVEYTTYAYGDGRIYNLFGQEINPWDVRPNRSIRLNDILIGQPDGAGDAKTAYITSVEYDAENGTVSWITDDNITLEGVFNLEKGSKATNERFGATQRSAGISGDNNGTAIKTTDSDGVSKIVVVSVPLLENAIINGDFAIAEDRASAAAIANGEYVCTTAQHAKATTGAVVTMEQDTDVPTVAEAGRKIPNSLKVDVTTADGTMGAADLMTVRLKLIGDRFANLLAQRLMVLRFWIKSDITGTLCTALRNSGADRSWINEHVISATGTWQRKQVLIDASPTGGTWDYTTGVGLFLDFALMCGSSLQDTPGSWLSANKLATSSQTNFVAANGNTVWITDVGLVALDELIDIPCRQRDPAAELVLTQRQYWKLHPNIAFGVFMDMEYNSATTARGVLTYPQRMRAAPTLSSSGTFQLQWSGIRAVSALAAGSVSRVNCQVAATTTAAVAGEVYSLRNNNDATAYIAMDARL